MIIVYIKILTVFARPEIEASRKYEVVGMCKSSVRSSPVIPYPTITPESPLKIQHLHLQFLMVAVQLKLLEQ